MVNDIIELFRRASKLLPNSNHIWKKPENVIIKASLLIRFNQSDKPLK